MSPLADEVRLGWLLAAERQRFRAAHGVSARHTEAAAAWLATGTPMHWMSQWPAGPIVVERASGDEITDLDGNRYADFCLGDSAALWGHGRAPLTRALAEQAAAGAQTMLPTTDAAWAAAELSRRFPVSRWQFTVSATDANRFALRAAREITGRPKVLLFDGKYHGCVDDTQVRLDESGQMVPTPGVAPNGVRFADTTALVEFNDLPALRTALASGEIACVLTEPALSNGGLIEPDPGFHAELRRLTREAGTLLIVDETQTIVAGRGGLTAAMGLAPDLVTLGKSLAGGVPCGAWGMTEPVAAALRRHIAAGGALANHAGFGGTLAGNALAMRAVRCVLGELSTPQAYQAATQLAGELRAGLAAVIGRHGLDWSVQQLGMRVWLLFGRPPRTGRDLRALSHPVLQEFLHVFLANRGVLLGPFSNGILVSPVTTTASVHTLLDAFAAALTLITAPHEPTAHAGAAREETP